MNLRRLGAVTAGGVGALVSANVALRRLASPLDPPLPGNRQTYRFRGMDISYTEAGDGPEVLLLHGLDTVATSYEWERIFDDLAETNHVIAPDLPGYGLSDRPPIAYDDAFYRDFLADFAADVAPGSTCVAASLPGTYASLIQRDADLFDRLVLVCPTVDPVAQRRDWIRSLVRSPIVGSSVFNALTSKPAIRFFDAKHGYGDPTRIPADVIDYHWQSAHQPGARYAPAAFLSGYLHPDEELSSALASAAVPVTLMWGRDADIPSIDTGRQLAEEADTKLVVFDNAKVLPHIEHGAEFLEALADELPVEAR